MGKFGNHERIVHHCDRERTQLWAEFDRVKPKLIEIARYIYPGALAGLVRDVKNLTADATYDEDDAERLTNVPFDAFRICYSGFYTNLTNPSAPWFRLGSPSFSERDDEDEDFEQGEYAKLTNATRWLMGWCGAYRPLHTAFKHLTAFGFAAVICEEDDARIAHCQCLRIGTYALGTDRRGKVDRVVRHFAFTAQQMIEEFGAENLSDNIVEAAKRDETDAKYEVWNIVEPHRKIQKVESPFTLSYKKFCYRSVYWSGDAKDNGADGLLAVRGFRVKPLVAPRLTFEPGDIYGRGCGADALGHCRALQTMSEVQLDIADQEAHPSMMAPASMADDGLRLGPCEVNFYQDGLQPNAVYRTVGNPPTGERTSQEQARIELEIRKAFFNSEFETINAMEDGVAQTAGSGDRMTATEVRARVNEKMEQLAGIATTLNDELLDPFVTMMASYAMMAQLTDAQLPRSGGASLPWDIKYESSIHAAVNAQPINAAVNSLRTASEHAAAAQDPSVFDNFDADKMVRDIHRKLGAPEKYLRRMKDIEKMRAERAKQQQQAAEAERQALAAKTLKDVASAPVTPDTIGGALAAAGNDQPM